MTLTWWVQPRSRFPVMLPRAKKVKKKNLATMTHPQIWALWVLTRERVLKIIRDPRECYTIQILCTAHAPPPYRLPHARAAHAMMVAYYALRATIAGRSAQRGDAIGWILITKGMFQVPGWKVECGRYEVSCEVDGAEPAA